MIPYPLKTSILMFSLPMKGEADIATASLVNSLRFPGQYFDLESGLHYNYWRYYDSSTGGYVTSDW